MKSRMRLLPPAVLYSSMNQGPLVTMTISAFFEVELGGYHNSEVINGSRKDDAWSTHPLLFKTRVSFVLHGWGFNLRNDMAHGLLAMDCLHRGHATRLIHTLLVLGIWDRLAEARKRYISN